MTQDSVMNLKSLLLDSKDGDWGKSEAVDGHIPVYAIRGTDFADVRFGNTSRVPLRYFPERTVYRRILEHEDILIETAGGSKNSSTGRTVLITADLLDRFPAVVSCASFARFLRIDDKLVNPRYVYWFLQNLHNNGEMWQYQVQHTGVARFQFTSFAERIYIPIRPRVVQDAMVSVLEALDNKIAVNDRIMATLDRLCHLQFEAKFEGGSRDNLEGSWRSGRLSDLCVTQYGYTASGVSDAVGPKLLRVKDINKQNWIRWDGVPYCEADAAALNKYKLKIGDILVARMADPGKSAIIEQPVDAVFASYLVRLKTSSLAASYFVWGFLKSKSYMRYIEETRGGSVQSNMNARAITQFECKIPPIDIMEEFSKSVIPLRKMILSALEENQSLAELRNALLPKLMSGELRVKDAERIVEDAT